MFQQAKCSAKTIIDFQKLAIGILDSSLEQLINQSQEEKYDIGLPYFVTVMAITQSLD